MVHSGNRFALSSRDKIVGKSLQTNGASINYIKGNNFKAALIDFTGNLFIGAVPQTAVGLSIIIPYFTVTYQGWVGGIVSVDSNHNSRFKHLTSALYYFIVILLQFIPYSLAIGSGIRLGIETYKLNRNVSVMKFKIDKAALRDVALIYIVVVPLFFVASCFEFLSPWNI